MSSVMACVRCHGLKKKCEYAASSKSCIRCLSSDRQCAPHVSIQGKRDPDIVQADDVETLKAVAPSQRSGLSAREGDEINGATTSPSDDGSIESNEAGATAESGSAFQQAELTPSLCKVLKTAEDSSAMSASKSDAPSEEPSDESESPPRQEETAAPAHAEPREPSSDAELLRLVDRLFLARTSCTTVREIYRKVAEHYGWEAEEMKKKSRKPLKKAIKARLTALVTALITGEATVGEGIWTLPEELPGRRDHSSIAGRGAGALKSPTPDDTARWEPRSPLQKSPGSCCKMAGCQKYKQSGRDGYCAAHFTEQKKSSAKEGEKGRPRHKHCKSPGCDKYPRGGGYCRMHSKELKEGPERYANSSKDFSDKKRLGQGRPLGSKNKKPPEGKKALSAGEERPLKQTCLDVGKAEPVQEWVQCDKCEKWRRLPPHISAEALPDVWYCSMSTWDINRATCTAVEEKHEANSPLRDGAAISMTKDAEVALEMMFEQVLDKAIDVCHRRLKSPIASHFQLGALKGPASDGTARSTKKNAASTLSTKKRTRELPREKLVVGWTKKVVSRGTAVEDKHQFNSPLRDGAATIDERHQDMKEVGALKSPTSDSTARPARKKAAEPLSERLRLTEAEPCEELGVGWTKKVVPRPNVKKAATKVDRFYFSPEGKQFASMAEVMRYLKTKSAKARKNAKNGACGERRAELEAGKGLEDKWRGDFGPPRRSKSRLDPNWRERKQQHCIKRMSEDSMKATTKDRSSPKQPSPSTAGFERKKTNPGRQLYDAAIARPNLRERKPRHRVQRMGKSSISTNQEPIELISLIDDGDLDAEASMPGRKRRKPQHFMEEQSQEMLARNELEKQRRENSVTTKRFSTHAFEQGCIAHGRDNWQLIVKDFVAGRTSKEREQRTVEPKATWANKPASRCQAGALKTARTTRKDAAATSSKKKDKGGLSKVSSVEAEPCEDLGAGWTKKVVRRQRPSGIFTNDIYYYSPEGKQYSSRVQAKRYLIENWRQKTSANAEMKGQGMKVAPSPPAKRRKVETKPLSRSEAIKASWVRRRKELAAKEQARFARSKAMKASWERRKRELAAQEQAREKARDARRQGAKIGWLKRKGKKQQMTAKDDESASKSSNEVIFLGKRKAPQEDDSGLVAALRAELEQEKRKVKRLKSVNQAMANVMKKTKEALETDLEEVRGDLDIEKETVKQQLLATDSWQSRFDELAARAAAGPVDGASIAEIRGRSLAGGSSYKPENVSEEASVPLHNKMDATELKRGGTIGKVKVGRISGYPIVVTQGQGEHEAILVGCDEDPERFIALKSGGELKIRWKIAGFYDSVPARDVRLLGAAAARA